MLVGLVAVVALAAISLIVGGVNLRDAEQHRLDERTRLTQQISAYTVQAYGSDKLRADVHRAGFTAASQALDELLLQGFQVTPTGDPNVVVTLFNRQGRPIATRPERNTLSVDLLGDAWPRALSGQVAEASAFRLNNELLRAYAIPVGAGRPWAVLVAVPRDESGRQFQQRLGGLGTKDGGFSSTDTRGVVFACWNPALLGTQQLSESDVSIVRAQGSQTWFTGSGRDRRVTIAVADPNTGFLQIFSQRTKDLYSDLSAAQRTRDILVLAVLTVALAGLMLLGWRRERTSRRSGARLHALLKHAHDLVLVVDPGSTTSFVSPAIEDLLGYDQATWSGRPLLEIVDPDDAERLLAMLGDRAGGRLLNLRLRASDGSLRWFDVESSELNGEEHLSGTLLTCHDVGERKDLQDQLSYQATHDALTGLTNRALFCENLEAVQRSAHRPSGCGVAVLFVDLDHFKPVNDTLGHDAGDQVLRTVARRLTAAVRSGDLTCRFSGDEFGVLLPGADETLASEIAQRLVQAIRAPIAVGASLVHIDASIGIALAQGVRAPHESERLIRDADEAMYLAKEAGRGRYAVHRGTGAGIPPPRTGGEGPRGPLGLDVDLTRVASAELRRSGAFPRSSLSTPARSFSLRRRVQHLVPLLVAGALVVGIATLGSVQEAGAQRHAEAKRVMDRSDITLRVAEYSAIVTDPGRLRPAIAAAPWNLNDPTANAAVLDGFSHSPVAGTNSIVALTRLDGTVLASDPPGSTVNLPLSSPTWEYARRGTSTLSPVLDATTTPRAWYTLPVLQNGEPTALLLIGQSERDAEVSKLMVAVGSLGLGEGGLADVDPSGTVYVAWDPKLIGTTILKPDDLAGLRLGDVRRIERAGRTLLITPSHLAGDPSPRFIVLSQPTSVFFGDLRSGQAARNLLLFVLVCVTVLGLALLNQRRELAERRSRARLHALLHHAHDLVVAVDSSGRTTFVSSAIEGLLGQAVNDWSRRAFLDLVTPDDRDRVGQALHEGWDDGEVDRVLADVRLLTVEGGVRWFDIGIVDLRANPSVTGLLLTCHEIGDRKRLQDELTHRAHHDVLTGLPNRATFAEHLTQVTSDGPRVYAVLFIDLDHFKPVNDRYGHDVGDAVLQAVAARIESTVRRDSRTRANDLLCRLGGDEFAVVLAGAAETDARMVAARILNAVAEPISVGSTQVVIGATIGIAFSDPGAPEQLQIDSVVQRADSAMYQAKAAGRGRYAIFGT